MIKFRVEPERRKEISGHITVGPNWIMFYDEGPSKRNKNETAALKRYLVTAATKGNFHPGGITGCVEWKTSIPEGENTLDFLQDNFDTSQIKFWKEEI